MEKREIATLYLLAMTTLQTKKGPLTLLGG